MRPFDAPAFIWAPRLPAAFCISCVVVRRVLEFEGASPIQLKLSPNVGSSDISTHYDYFGCCVRAAFIKVSFEI